MHASDFFYLPKNLTIFSKFFPPNEVPWNWIENIQKALVAYGNRRLTKARNHFFKRIQSYFSKRKTLKIGENVHIGKDVKLPKICTIENNVYIGNGTEIRSGALIRKNVIIGENCVIGNSCEIKNSLLMDHVQVAHFNYVGDSVLGSHSHLSAGAILSNLRFDGKPISIKVGEEKIITKLEKFGAILGEYAQVGCNSVLLPGTLISKNSIISVGMSFGGFLEKNQIVYADMKNVIVQKNNEFLQQGDESVSSN